MLFCLIFLSLFYLNIFVRKNIVRCCSVEQSFYYYFSRKSLEAFLLEPLRAILLHLIQTYKKEMKNSNTLYQKSTKITFQSKAIQFITDKHEQPRIAVNRMRYIDRKDQKREKKSKYMMETSNSLFSSNFEMK